MVSLKHVFVATLTLAAAGCAPASETPPGTAQHEAASLWTVDTRTVLTGEAARDLIHQCSRVSPGPVEDLWTPSDADIAALEAELILLVARELEARGESPSLGDYYRQYAGFVIGGKRVIYVNGVNAAGIDADPGPAFHPSNWRAYAIQICDGGTITFGAEYDPETEVFRNFAFNGSL
ncbi:MAG: hypothetical protein ABL871_03965 [Terricaulis sp.]